MTLKGSTWQHTEQENTLSTKKMHRFDTIEHREERHTEIEFHNRSNSNERWHSIPIRMCSFLEHEIRLGGICRCFPTEQVWSCSQSVIQHGSTYRVLRLISPHSLTDTHLHTQLQRAYIMCRNEQNYQPNFIAWIHCCSPKSADRFLLLKLKTKNQFCGFPLVQVTKVQRELVRCSRNDTSGKGAYTSVSSMTNVCAGMH